MPGASHSIAPREVAVYSKAAQTENSEEKREDDQEDAAEADLEPKLSWIGDIPEDRPGEVILGEGESKGERGIRNVR